MKILGIIPARGGSKGIPGKNLKNLLGKPLIQYSIEAAMKSKELEDVIVSSDDPDIISVARSCGVDVPFVRPSDLAEDNSPTLPVIQHALKHFIENHKNFDAVCLLQPTNPLRTVEDIDRAISEFRRKKTDSLISVLEVPHQYNPHWQFKEGSNGDLELFTEEDFIIPRRQELPKTFFRDGSIYITRSEVLLNQNSLYGKRISYIISDEDRYVNIDSEKDWILAEKMLQNQKSNE